ncbi:MAG: hypothetical protein ACC653_12705 [Gammaproteobacteria bacterium]
MIVKQIKSTWGFIMESISLSTLLRYALLAIIVFVFALTMV